MQNQEGLPLQTILMDAIKDMVFVVRTDDADFRYAFINEAVVANTGLDQSVIGKTLEETLPDAQARFFKSMYSKTKLLKQKVTYEDSYLTTTGEWHYAKSEMNPLFDDAGNCNFIVCVTKDLTTEKLALLEKKTTARHLQEKQAHYHSLFENNTDAVFTLDLDGLIQEGNMTVTNLSGYPIDAIIGKHLSYFIDIDAAELLEFLHQSANHIYTSDKRVMFLHRLGMKFGVLLKVIPIKVESRLVGLFAVLKDMRELDKLASLLIDTEEKFRLIAEYLNDTILLTDETGKVSYAAPSVEKTFGYKPEEIVGKSAIPIIPQDVLPIVFNEFERASVDRTTTTFQVPLYHQKGHLVWSEVSITPVFDKQNHTLIIARDFTLQKDRETQLHHFAYNDYLTGIPNRRLFTERLTQRILQHDERQSPFAIALFDVDHFKNINDEFGHEVGDYVITELADRLQSQIGDDNLVARLGGDEFVIMLEAVDDADQVLAMYEKIKVALKEPWIFNDQLLTVSVSAGFTLIGEGKKPTVSEALHDADRAMYRAKKIGQDGMTIRHYK